MKTTKKILISLAVIAGTTLFASDGAKIYNSCVGCHGANAEKQALGKSAVIKGWDVEKTIAALKGYKDGSYGGPMKGVMKGQVTRLSDTDIKAVAEHISKLK
ncbi:cytochrome C [Arcobacter sp. CECT 8983]|uniref:c-type cytochrome n=1 Tax=Arcobacter sp. CECT 8983 TaxID=2044508 RepID=UPI00100BBE06|nr:c-type cytochrome [Arcobacter sp. CECT 8983]RXJ89131.1 cytochrome C [Arcobacter sp. CECT 8983]